MAEQLSPDALTRHATTVLRLTVMKRGERESVTGHAGEPLLAPLQRAGLSLPSICGGKGACGTCRVHLPSIWHDRLTEPSRREGRLLAHVGANVGDRLSCQIVLTADLDGLEIHTCNEKEIIDGQRRP